MKRAVLVEAGHRCAIPTCRQTPVQLAHIKPWAKVNSHTFDNLIALCPTCHTRYDRGEIDRKAMLQYKANLEILNHRYTDLERQLIKEFVRRWQRVRRYHPTAELSDLTRLLQTGRTRIYEPMSWAFSNLLDDGLIEFRTDHLQRAVLKEQEERLVAIPVELTAKGCEFVKHYVAAQPLD